MESKEESTLRGGRVQQAHEHESESRSSCHSKDTTETRGSPSDNVTLGDEKVHGKDDKAALRGSKRRDEEERETEDQTEDNA